MTRARACAPFAVGGLPLRPGEGGPPIPLRPIPLRPIPSAHGHRAGNPAGIREHRSFITAEISSPLDT